MTSPSRRKRPTILAPITAAPTPARLAVLAVLVVAGLASRADAQSQYSPLRPAQAIPPTEVIPTPVPMPRVPTMQVPSPIVLARFQQPNQRNPSGDDDQLEYQIQLEPPGLERLSGSMKSDLDLQENIRQETLARTKGRERISFPEEPILSRGRYFGRGGIWPQRAVVAEANFVCYDKLFFEDKNSERYGWELGMMQTFLSPLLFFADVTVFPCRYFKNPCDHSDCSAGHCLPGDPVPYRLYPPEITATGTLAELATILALVVVFP